MTPRKGIVMVRMGPQIEEKQDDVVHIPESLDIKSVEPTENDTKDNETANYQTPPEKDESLIDLPPEMAHLEGIVTAHKYRNGVIYKGGKYTTGLIDEISNKLNRNKSVVINITGPPGVGKTWFALAFAQFFDPKFHIMDSPAPEPRQDHGQVCFERDHISYLVGADSPLKRGQAIVLDEAHFGMGARGFQNKDQVSIVNLIAAIRSKGFMLIIVTLHSSMLDKIPREYVINYEFAVQDEGVAKTYSRYFPTFAKKAFNKGKGKLEVELPDPYDEESDLGCDCPDCLECEYMKTDGPDRCFNLRATYERRKEEFLNKMSAADEPVKPKLTREQRVELILDNRGSLCLNTRGLIDIGSLQAILAQNDEPNGENTARSIKTMIEKYHPEVVMSLSKGVKNP